MPAAYLSVDQSAELLGVNPKTIRRAIARGVIPAYRVGSLVRIRRSDLESAFPRIPSAASR